jgi:hypothetical protein
MGCLVQAVSCIIGQYNLKAGGIVIFRDIAVNTTDVYKLTS